jgi:repressor LexA
MGRPPTDRQLEVHAVMFRFQTDYGLPPTVRELADLLGIASTNGVIDHLVALEKRGLVKHHRAGASRAWVAIQPLPEEGTSP